MVRGGVRPDLLPHLIRLPRGLCIEAQLGRLPIRNVIVRAAGALVDSGLIRVPRPLPVRGRDVDGFMHGLLPGLAVSSQLVFGGMQKRAEPIDCAHRERVFFSTHSNTARKATGGRGGQ